MLFYFILCVAVFVWFHREFGVLAAAASVIFMTTSYGSVYLGRSLYGEIPALAYFIIGLILWGRSLGSKAPAASGLWLFPCNTASPMKTPYDGPLLAQAVQIRFQFLNRLTLPIFTGPAPFRHIRRTPVRRPRRTAAAACRRALLRSDSLSTWSIKLNVRLVKKENKYVISY